MTNYATFSDGYLDGWRSVLGQGAALPGIPSYAIPVGKTEYDHGYDEGRRTATERSSSPDLGSN